jgi:GNAT superfamily N-acetyltransferase
VIRRLGAGEAELLRRVRLSSLADSPSSFATTLTDASALPGAEWAAQAAAPGEAVFVALRVDGEPVGIAGARPHADDGETIALWGMWVAPAARRSGLGERLVAAVAGWAAEQGAARLRLGVMTDVPAAIAFYERLGFQQAGEPRVFRRDPSRRWWEMFRAL